MTLIVVETSYQTESSTYVKDLTRFILILKYSYASFILGTDYQQSRN